MTMKDFARPEGLYLKFAEPLMEPNTPVIIERVNGDCTVSQFIIARDEAYKLVGQMREFLHVPAAPSAGSGQSAVNTIAFGKTETMQDIKDNKQRLAEALKEAGTALAAAAPKPAPPAEHKETK